MPSGHNYLPSQAGAWLGTARSHLCPLAYPLASSHADCLPNPVPEKTGGISQPCLSFGSSQVLQTLSTKQKIEWEAQCPAQSLGARFPISQESILITNREVPCKCEQLLSERNGDFGPWSAWLWPWFIHHYGRGGEINPKSLSNKWLLTLLAICGCSAWVSGVRLEQEGKTMWLFRVLPQNHFCPCEMSEWIATRSRLHSCWNYDCAALWVLGAWLSHAEHASEQEVPR